MKYSIKELYLTLQGEGFHAGRPAVFCRFTGCNLWSGREHDRRSAICRFCDTDFVGTDGSGGGSYETAGDLAQAIAAQWPGADSPFVVCTGGEPLLQLDETLVAELHRLKFEVAVETNGTLPVPTNIDWVCVSPKANTEVIARTGNELKLVYPQEGIRPAEVASWEFEHYYLQPMDGPHVHEARRKAIEYCLKNPLWKLSTQTHKLVGIK